MTKGEWAQVQKELENFYTFVELDIDGYQISLSLVRISAYKNAIAIYVNGVFKGEWMTKDCEERRRFLPKKERSLFSAKDKAGWKKLSKKTQKEFEERYNTKYTYYESHWRSFSALKRHLIANNESIKLLSVK